MQLKAVLFDLDGTLLPMDQDVFIQNYFGRLARKLAPLGYDPKQLIAAVWAGTEAMVKNNGAQTNEALFWQSFCGTFGEKAREDEPVFTQFYANEFQEVRTVCGFDANAAPAVRQIKAAGLRVALATNPLFPAIATQSRIRWAGLEPADFELYTTYENARHCKPNLDYYRDILAQLDVKPEECLMVGNDVGEDMIAAKLGMRVFLLTDCLINKQNLDISNLSQGSFPELMAYIDELR